MPKIKLDAYDRKILAALQRDGRLSNVELADEIGLSASPCLRRVRMLEEAGVIRGYQVNLDRDEVGLGLTVFVGVKVERHHEADAEAFRLAVTALPQVISAFLVSGGGPRPACLRTLPHRRTAAPAGSARYPQQLCDPGGEGARTAAARSSSCLVSCTVNSKTRS